jgi:hypothetical protein
LKAILVKCAGSNSCVDAMRIDRRLLFVGLALTACAPASSAGTVVPTTIQAPPETSNPFITATLLPAHTTAATSAPPTATLAPTDISTITPTLVVLNPLTGLAVADPSTLERRPLAIKIAQFPRRVREHQFGLSQADNVWEHYAEGGVTRFTAIFLSQSPEKVGNIRSARLVDTILGEAYQAMLVASGSSQGTLDRLKETNFYNRVIAEATGYKECPILCREAPKTETTDKLFTDPAALWELTTKLGLNGRQNLEGFVFDGQPPASGVQANTIHLDFQLNNSVTEWRYDPVNQTYARWVDTANLPTLDPHVDALTGQQLTASNVIILYVLHAPSNIREDESGQYYSYEIFLTGNGPAKLFRDGMLYEVNWVRDSAGLPRFVDANRNAVPFKPGPTWFEVVTPDSPTKFDAAQALFTLRFKAPDPFPELTATP